MDRLYDLSQRETEREGEREERWMMGVGKRKGQKFLAELKGVPFPFSPILNYRAGRLHLPGGTILIRKLAKSLRTMGTIVGKEKSERGPASEDIEDVRIAGR